MINWLSYYLWYIVLKSSHHPLNCIVCAGHIYKWDKNAGIFGKHLVCLGCFELGVYEVVYGLGSPIYVDFDSVSGFESISLGSILGSFFAIVAMVTQGVAGVPGKPWVLLFMVIDDPYLNISAMSVEDFKFEFRWGVRVDPILENIMSPLIISSNILHLKSFYFKVSFICMGEGF